MRSSFHLNLHPTATILLWSLGLFISQGSSSAFFPSAEPTLYTYEVVASWPHDREAFTQGLTYLDGQLFESTGLKGHSTLRKVDLQTGRVTQEFQLAAEYFAEGMTILNHKAFQLTWRNHKAFVYDLDAFKVEKEFSYEGEGWGLTTDGKWLIMSNGTDELRFIDPDDFHVVRTVHVLSHGEPIKNLNELEYIKGEIFANVWQTNWVVRIDPSSGTLLGVIKLSELLPPEEYTATTDVLNGIAYDASTDRLFITGKNWPKLFEIRLRAQPQHLDGVG